MIDLKNKTIGSALLFALIFAGAFYVRQFTFWLPHWQGDQSQYVMLAMKLQTSRAAGYEDYNLKGINTEVLRIDGRPPAEIIYPYRVEGQRGFVLDTYYENGLAYYDTPIFYKSPMLPQALALSQRIFGSADRTFAVVKSNLGKEVLDTRPAILLKAQFWAAIIPFASSLLILTLIFFWTRALFGNVAALVAAFIFATNPVSILTSYRVWTEDLALLLLLPAMILYRAGFKSGRWWLCGAAGVLYGGSVLTSQKSLLAAGALAFYSMLMMRAEKKSWVRMLADRRWWAFAATAAAMTAHWFWTMYSCYGNPLAQPVITDRMLKGREIASVGGFANIGDWYQVLLSQPHGVIYYSVGTVAICWAFAAAYLTVKDGLKNGLAAWSQKPFDDRPVFLWCWITFGAGYFLTHRTGEYRYLHMIYPALAALSGWMIVRLERRLSGIMAHRFLSVGIVALILAASAAHSVRTVMPVLWEQKNLITAPWN